MQIDKTRPKACTHDMVVQEVDRDTLVYDKKRHQAHCLNSLASLIWRHCDGQRNLPDLAKLAHEQLGVPNDVQLIEVGLHDLAQAKLLDIAPEATPEQRHYTRREVARRLGVAAAAGLILLPVITSVGTASAQSIASPKTTTTTPSPMPPK
jgi:hypothetical protein